MPVIKPRAPEYPRPVSPICADEIPTCKDTILYCDDDDSREEDDKQKGAKRRRIEAHATSYLRGQPMFILTAQMRGPFDDGWQNPWARKKTTVKAARNPQHSSKLLKPMDHAVYALPPLAQQPPARVATDANEVTDPHILSQGRGQQQHAKVPESRPVEDETTVDPSIFGKCVQVKDKRVENWLRTSEAYGIPGYRNSTSTPPSPSDGRKKPQKSPGPENHISHRENIILKSPSDDAPRQTKPSKEPANSISSPLQDRALLQDNETKDSRSSPVRPGARRTPLRNRDSNVLLASTIESRAEYAILKSRRDRIQLNTSTMDTDSRQHSVDIHLGGEIDALQHSQPADDQSVSASLQIAQEQPLSKHEELRPMSPGKQTSESGVTTDLPSAQVPEIPILPSLPSNISSHDQMLQDSPYHERVAFEALKELDKTTVVQEPAGETVQPDQHAASNPESRALTRLEVEANNQQAHVPEVNESAVTSKLALEGASKSVRILQASFEGVSKGASPVGIKKTSGLKSRKRQTFAREENSGSIKTALKVARPSAASEETTKGSKAYLESDASQQVQGAESYEEVPECGSPITSRISVPKSILKAVVTQQSMKASASNTGSSSTRDAQKQRVLNPVDNEDGFDLEGAIDDLGSYLDTWDAEKQTAGIL
ncbi:hypothetical protein H2200_012594 [Cladophialophora chaetospira]|uniref:Protamine P1 n=1 Tax=Cladophialophora chaetospira TaxID=386627 RepID=A0AA38WX88_9EURO|nr:hypothetical protein H2200_012594 [Cladophialophora chaetospira]